MPDSMRALWSYCAAISAETFSLRLFGQFDFQLHFSPAWPAAKIKKSLAVNLCKNASSGWQIHCLTTRECDITPYLNAFSRDPHGQLDLQGNTQLCAFYDSLHHIFRIYDFAGRRAAIITAETYVFKEWELHSPLREFWHLWALKNDAILIHSGVVTAGGNAILLPGAGGSGKSTTVLSCLHHRMKTTGDDYNILRAENGIFRATPLYGNLKLKNTKGEGNFDFPMLPEWESEPLPYAGKTIYTPPASSPIWDHSTPKITGILCPHIASIPHPETSNMKQAELISRLAVSSIMQSPFMAKEYLAKAASLARSVRCTKLHLSPDAASNATHIRQWLEHK
jgi:hypothetical protein